MDCQHLCFPNCENNSQVNQLISYRVFPQSKQQQSLSGFKVEQ